MAPGILRDSLTASYHAEEPSYGLLAAEALDSVKSQSVRQQPLAVVGFSLKFPHDATSTESFWSMLMERRSAMTEIPKDRMNLDSFYSPDASRRDTVSKNSFAGQKSTDCKQDTIPRRSLSSGRHWRLRRAILLHHSYRGCRHGSHAAWASGNYL